MEKQKDILCEKLSEEEKKKKDSAKKAREERAKREREWDASKPGIDFYSYPDLDKYMERIKAENPDFAQFLDDVKSGKRSDVPEKIYELAKKIEQELNQS